MSSKGPKVKVSKSVMVREVESQENASTSKKRSTITSENLIEKGNLCISNMQFELAIKFYRKALTLKPDDTRILDMLAEVLLQMGESSEAFSLLQTSVSLQPNSNPSNWCYLAQLQESFEALSSYQKAIEVATMLNLSINSEDQKSFQKLIAKTYCSIADLYMTDLCLESNAEAECEKSVNMSLATVPSNLDALQTLASLRLSQSRPLEAADVMKEVYSKIRQIRDEWNSKAIMTDMTSSTDEQPQLPDIPESTFCVTTAKLLIECAAVRAELAENSLELITDLLEYDDENIELWYLAGVASLTMIPVDLESARYHLEKASSMLQTTKKKAREQGEDFCFNEQEEIVNDHMKILTELEGGGDRQENVKESNEMLVENDEEWSLDEDES